MSDIGEPVLVTNDDIGEPTLVSPPQQEWRQGTDPSLFDRVMGLFQDPDKERAKAVQALVDSDALGISPSDAMRYRTQIDQGVKINPKAAAASRRTTTLDRVKQSFDIGVKQNQVGEIGYKYVMTGNPTFLDDMNKITLPTDDEAYISEGPLEGAFRAAAKMFPMMADTGVEAVGKGLQMGMVVGGAAALRGNLAGVPKATVLGFTIGSTAGAFESALRKEAGLAVSDIIRFTDAQGNQIDPNIARAAAFGIGVVNAGIEVSQLKTLLKTIPGMDKLFSTAILEAVTSKTVKEKLLNLAESYASTVLLKETAPEVAQESSNIVFEELSKQVNNALKGTNIDPATVDQVLTRIHDTAVESVKAFSVMAAPGNVVRAGMTVMPQKAAKTQPRASGATEQGTQQQATPTKPTGPVILGVNENDAGETTGFIMADSETGQTFEVKATKQKVDEEGTIVRLTPDMEAVKSEMDRITTARTEEADLDTRLDSIIQSDTDLDEEAKALFEGGQIDETVQMQGEEGIVTEGRGEEVGIIEQARSIVGNERGSIDIEPIVNLARAIYAEGKTTIEAFTSRAKELLGEVWEKVKDLVKQAWDVLANERGSVNIDRGAKKRIRETTGQTKGEKVVTDMDALKAAIKKAEQASKIAYKAGQKDIVKAEAKKIKSLKQQIKEFTGQRTDEAKTVTEYDALTASWKKAAQAARVAYREGKKDVMAEAKEKMKWIARRRQYIADVRDFFGLTDSEMMKISRKSPFLMSNLEFHEWLQDVYKKAVFIQEHRDAKIRLIDLITQKRLSKVDNYRKALGYPSIEEMATQQLEEFSDLLEPFQDDDVFLTQREIETVDNTDLKGIRTWREARERLAAEAGVPVEELNSVHVHWADSFKWDTALREQDAFHDLLVTKMTQAMLGSELSYHDVETEAFQLARKSDKSRDRSLVEKAIPQDEQIMTYLEAPDDMRSLVEDSMTPEQLDYAHFIKEYFAKALDYLIATKSLERGRENYFVHIRKSFLENAKDKGLITAIKEMFKNFQEDQAVFNILDDDTGNILPLQKFFQFSLQRTGELDPTSNVTKAFLTYVRIFERKKAFDAIIPKLDIYTQALTPTRYTERGLEYDSSLKKFVNKWINNKKGRRISYDSVIRQGGPLDMAIRGLRTFTTLLDIGLNIPVGVASFVGEQVATFEMLGVKGYQKGSTRMRTQQGQAILKKYQVFTDRGFFENFAAPGKEVTERLTEGLFGLFHASNVTANKQFLLGSLTEEEWASGGISPERLAVLRLEMGRFRVVPGGKSLVGSTSIGSAATQYKTWAIPIMRTLVADAKTLAKTREWTSREAQELYRFVGLCSTILIVGAMAAGDDKDESYLGKMRARAYRESLTLLQAIDPKMFLGTPRTMMWLSKVGEALHSIAVMDGAKGGKQLYNQFAPSMLRKKKEKENR